MTSWNNLPIELRIMIFDINKKNHMSERIHKLSNLLKFPERDDEALIYELHYKNGDYRCWLIGEGEIFLSDFYSINETNVQLEYNFFDDEMTTEYVIFDVMK
jgi:hypothetical protein